MAKSDGDLRSLFRKHLPMVHWTTIETRFTEAGVPDTNGCYNRKEFWLEFKSAKGKRIELRPAQIAWHMRRSRNGGTTYICVRKRTSKFDCLFIFPGHQAKQIKIQGLNLPARCWNGGPSEWPWFQILSFLTVSR